MTLLSDNAQRILYEAIEKRIGIVVCVENTEGIINPVLRAKQILYRFKKDNPIFKNIQIRLSPNHPDRELWLINKEEETE